MPLEQLGGRVMRFRANDRVSAHQVANVLDAVLAHLFGLAERPAHTDDFRVMLFDPRFPGRDTLLHLCMSCLLGKGVPGCHARAGFASEKDSEKRIIRAHSVSSCSTLIVRSTNVCEHMSRGTLAWGAVGIFTLAGIPDIIEMSAATRRLDRGDVDLLHGHHRIKRALSFIASGRQRLCQHARRDLPGDAPLVFAPAASAFLPAIADDGVPVSIGLVLIVGRDLEREGFVMFERRTAVDADTGDAGNREFDDQHITRLARWVVTGCTVDGAYRAVGEGRG
jgi:hypothetical protein